MLSAWIYLRAHSDKTSVVLFSVGLSKAIQAVVSPNMFFLLSNSRPRKWKFLQIWVDWGFLFNRKFNILADDRRMTVVGQTEGQCRPELCLQQRPKWVLREAYKNKTCRISPLSAFWVSKSMLAKHFEQQLGFIIDILCYPK